VKIVVAISGASGMVVSQRLLEELQDHEVHLVVSDSAQKVIDHELGKNAVLPATRRYSAHEIDAPISSSSFPVDAMVVVPCSMKTLSAIANGYANDLIVRSAEIALRTNRKCIVVPRETPLSLASIENMRSVRLSGGIILPMNLAYYFGPKTMEDVNNFFVGKILDMLGIHRNLFPRWEGMPED
jgi:4-hydroxy-3-polyprenylbenzoate decarboxylase